MTNAFRYDFKRVLDNKKLHQQPQVVEFKHENRRIRDLYRRLRDRVLMEDAGALPAPIN